MSLISNRPTDFYCFIHIEKCAGTTLSHSLKYNMPGYLSLKPWYYWSNEPQNYLHARELKFIKTLFPFLQGIGGHTTRTYAEYESIIKKDIKYFTFLRNPIKRYLSHFNHQVNKMDVDWSIESFISEERFNNIITTRIAGKPDINLAIERLKNDFTFVGLLGKYDESILLLNQIVFNNSINPWYEHKNDSKNEEKVFFEDLSSNLQNTVTENNKLDIELYNYVIKELYPSYKVKYKGNLAKDLKAFKKKNKDYTYNKLKYYLINSTRLYSEKTAEEIAHFLNRNCFTDQKKAQ